MKTKSLFFSFSVIVLIMGFSSVVCAGTVSGVLGGGTWTGWTQFQVDDNGGNGEDWVDNGKVYPGTGGQAFDAEYLFYKLNGNTLSLGLQTGFDIVDGKYTSTSSGKDYYAGDIALSFDGTPTYTHALDFGLLTQDYGNHNVGADGGPDAGGSSDGIDDAGLYSVSKWNTHVISGFGASNPFAMDGGTKLADLTWTTNFGPTVNNDTSFYRQVSFDIEQFRQGDGSLWVDAHWTMSCGNDAINGTINVPVPTPEPATIALLGIGLAGLAGAGARRKWKKKVIDKS